MVKTTVILAAALLCTPAALSAQDPTPVAVGDRVRVRFPSSVTDPGTLTALNSDSLSLRFASGEVYGYAVQDFEFLEVSRGTQTPVYRGLGIGFVAGAGVVILAEHTAGASSKEYRQPALLGGLAGAGVGALVGLLMRTERWESVSLQVSTGRSQQEPAFRLGFTIAF